MTRARSGGGVRAALAAVAAASCLAVSVAVWVVLPLPDDLARPGIVPSLVIQDRHGLTLRTTRADDGSRGGWIAIDDVDPKIIQAFVAVEDRRYFEHRGVDLAAIARAARDNLAVGRIVSGASTITMQTARLLRPMRRTWTGKLAQALWALRLEAHLDKSRILEHYLNRVPLGQGAVGVQAAAALYFGRSAADVSLGQAALLAALARAPSRDNPLVDASRARRLRDSVLDRMLALGYATPADVDRAREEPVLGNLDGPRFLAPHYTTYLLRMAEERGVAWLEGWWGQEGAAAVSARDVVLDGTWRTTLDLELQRALEAEVRHTVQTLADRGGHHAAVVALDNRTGGILAWVGSPDFWADTAGQVDMVISRRQSGSTLKPFLYGLAFDRGYTAATVLPDVPRTYATATGPYRPQNYDRRFRGPVRARVALASSLNVPTVELAERLGVGAFLATLRGAGFASLDRPADHYGLGLALGNGEVTLLELANAYRALANGGVWRPVRWLEGEEASRDRSGAAMPADGTRFLSPGATALVLDILSDPVARIPGFGVETPLDFPFPAASKTGTSRHFTDNWAVATTGGFTVAAWVGNFSGRPMRGVSGISGAGPLLYRAMLQTARRYDPGHLPTPEQVGAVAVPICLLSGLLASDTCPSTIEWFLPGTEPTRVDDWHQDGRIVLPPIYAEWSAMAAPEAGYAVAPVDGADARPASAGPALPVDARTSAEAPNAVTAADPATATTIAPTTPGRIVSPRHGDIYEVPVGVDARYATIPLIASGDGGERVRWFVDGRPHEGTRWRLAPGAHWILAVWASGHRDSVQIEVR